MKLAIFGGTGRTGIHLVQQALERDFELKVLARSPKKMRIEHDNLEVIEGNTLNLDDVSKVIDGSDIVISVMGPTKNTPDNLMQNAASNIREAMKDQKLSRILYLTGAGVRAEEDQPGIIDKIFNFLLKLFSGDILEDSLQGVEVLTSSELNYTIVRAPRLTEGDPKDEYTIGYVGDISSSLTRADLATAILDLIDNEQWYRKMPAVSN